MTPVDRSTAILFELPEDAPSDTPRIDVYVDDRLAGSVFWGTPDIIFPVRPGVHRCTAKIKRLEAELAVSAVEGRTSVVAVSAAAAGFRGKELFYGLKPVIRQVEVIRDDPYERPVKERTRMSRVRAVIGYLLVAVWITGFVLFQDRVEERGDWLEWPMTPFTLAGIVGVPLLIHYHTEQSRIARARRAWALRDLERKRGQERRARDDARRARELDG